MESYIITAWNIFLSVITYMNTTTILSVGGINITFMGLAVFIVFFNILSWVVFELFDV